ncbi:MAG TPA: winged helix-turn-helix transcriptional regulator [Candidatus Bathyarchaeia archaeon]|nr:winged helix-turn-helix transcriptional regulator [Candidatus Bathyarchaeia archaeon]
MSVEEQGASRRDQILEFINANPGVHLRMIKRNLNLAMGVIQYHLYRLEKERRIVSMRRGLYKRFYPSLGFGEEQKEILSLLSQETARDLLLYLIQKPGSSQKQLSEFAQISPASINWHMKRLSEVGFVDMRREGSSVHYNVKGDPVRILRLLKDYHPSIWERWADRLADLLT